MKVKDLYELPFINEDGEDDKLILYVTDDDSGLYEVLFEDQSTEIATSGLHSEEKCYKILGECIEMLKTPEDWEKVSDHLNKYNTGKVFIVTSMKEPYDRIREVARYLSDAIGAEVIYSPAFLNQYQEKEFADQIIDKFVNIGTRDNLIVATFYETAILRLLRKLAPEEQIYFNVYKLPGGLDDIQRIEVYDNNPKTRHGKRFYDNEMQCQWMGGGFFEGRHEELFPDEKE